MVTNDDASIFLSPFSLNQRICLQNRLVMAPMTRCFADQNHVPTEEMADYYAKRGQAGLIVSEATMISPHASGYPNTPGIFSRKQIEGWRKVCQRVHPHGAKFFLQLWHAGMMSHPIYRGGAQTISASSIAPKKEFIPRTDGRLKYGVPKQMDQADMEQAIEEFATSAEYAMEAGCDGIELHAANGYMLDSFLHYFTNRRLDEYGGTPENLCRFVLKVVDAVAQKIGAERLGIRLSPVPVPSMENVEDDIRDQHVFSHLLLELGKRQIAYVHACSDHDVRDCGFLGMPVTTFIRKFYKGNVIGCGSYDLKTGSQALRQKAFDLLAFGRLFIANPDLIDAIRNNPQPDLKQFAGSMLTSL